MNQSARTHTRASNICSGERFSSHTNLSQINSITIISIILLKHVIKRNPLKKYFEVFSNECNTYIKENQIPMSTKPRFTYKFSPVASLNARQFKKDKQLILSS